MFNVRRKVHSQESKAMVVKLASIILDRCPVETVDAEKLPYSSKVDMCENREKPLTIGFLNHHFVPLLTTKFDKSNKGNQTFLGLYLAHHASHKVSTMNNQYDELNFI
ncbi:hypothetical protein BpHYR1_038457 [Brachionus plicatilis]|uniref:Uncharacterized protein n=1 Tax=Brachionus plicatilis TaxID=10195 RepID=A0A3M7S8S8_BRAPC|nr:hypothetical protein BpHYR1_038457 [Brachionus plicatilis]